MRMICILVIDGVDMTPAKLKRTVSTGSLALAVALAFQHTALAQEVPEAAEAGEGEFLGTLTLGESKRAVKTDTATPETTIDQEEIDDRQAATIAELIDSVPGVALVNGSTPTGSGINIRGFGANGTYGTDQKVAILVDNASVGSEELYRIGTQLYTDPGLYQSVDVIRGTVGSFEYGSGIVGGVVRLQTIDASGLTGGKPGFALRQTLGASSNQMGFNSSTTAAWQASDRFEVLTNYSWREQGNQKDGDGNEIGNSAFEMPSFLIKGRYTFGAQSLTASYTDSSTSERDVPYDSFGTSGGAFGNVDRDTQSQTFTLDYRYDPENNDLIDVQAILSYANQEIDQEATTPPGFAVINADHQYETWKLTLKNASYIETGAVAQNLRYGLELIRKERLDANSAPGGTDERIAVFLINEIAFLDGWTLTPALRYETSEVEGNAGAYDGVSYENDALMGGASLRYEFSNGLAFFGSYAYTESLPILDDLNNVAYMRQPEVATTYELGASYDKIGVFTPDDFLSLKTNLYQTELEDVTSYSGVTGIELQGIEVEAAYAMKAGFYVDFNATITDGEETRTSGTIFDWRNLPADRMRFTLGQRFANLVDLSGEVVAVDERNLDGTVTPGYVVPNLRATITPREGVLEGTAFRFSVENLLDHDYTPALATRPAPGRNFKFSITKTF